MPRVKSTMTSTEEKEYLESAQWLASAGAAIEIADHVLSKSSPLRIDQSGPEFYHKVFNLYQARLGVIVSVSLLARHERITICGCRFTLPWCQDLDLFPFRIKGLGVPEEDIFNTRLEEGLSLRKGEPVEVVLTAKGSAPLPKCYRHGASVGMDLVFCDQFANEYTAKMELHVDRRIGGKSDDLKRRSNLYGCQGSKREYDPSLPKASREATLHVGDQVSRVTSSRFPQRDISTGAPDRPLET